MFPTADPLLHSPALDLDAPLVSASRRPRYIVVAERHALSSAARIMWVELSHGGGTWRLCSLADALTYPAWRRRGYASAAVGEATRIIQADHETDLALLLCDASIAGLYAAHGRRATPGLTATKGLDEREPHEGLPMLLFVSHRARAADFETAELALPGYGW